MLRTNQLGVSGTGAGTRFAGAPMRAQTATDEQPATPCTQPLAKSLYVQIGSGNNAAVRRQDNTQPGGDRISCLALLGLRGIFGRAKLSLCFVAIYSTGWSQPPSPVRQVAGTGVQASFHDTGPQVTTDALVSFNDNAQVPGMAPTLFVKVTESNGEQNISFFVGPSPTFNYHYGTDGSLTLAGTLTVSEQPPQEIAQTRTVSLNLKWTRGVTNQKVSAHDNYSQPGFSYTQDLQGDLQRTTVSGTLTVNGLQIPADPSTPTFWNTKNSRRDNTGDEREDSSELSTSSNQTLTAAAPIASSSTNTGFWTGYWTWDSTRRIWFWTWVWNSSTGWVVLSWSGDSGRPVRFARPPEKIAGYASSISLGNTSNAQERQLKTPWACDQ